MSHPYITKSKIVSPCCQSEFYHDSDICTDCGQHCGEGEQECPDCEGGFVEIVDEAKVNSATIDIPYKKIKCETCNGTGSIVVDLEL